MGTINKKKGFILSEMQFKKISKDLSKTMEVGEELKLSNVSGIRIQKIQLSPKQEAILQGTIHKFN